MELLERELEKGRLNTSVKALGKLTTIVDGNVCFLSKPPRAELFLVQQPILRKAVLRNGGLEHIVRQTLYCDGVEWTPTPPIVVVCCEWLVAVDDCLPRLLMPRSAWLDRHVHLATLRRP